MPPPRDESSAAEQSRRNNNSFPDLLQATPSSSPENSDDDASQPPIPSPASSHGGLDASSCLYKDDMDDFFAWAFFGKHFLALMPWESKELDKIYETLKKEQNITFPKKPSQVRKVLIVVRKVTWRRHVPNNPDVKAKLWKGAA